MIISHNIATQWKILTGSLSCPVKSPCSIDEDAGKTESQRGIGADDPVLNWTIKAQSEPRRLQSLWTRLKPGHSADHVDQDFRFTASEIETIHRSKLLIDVALICAECNELIL